jgi:hypothetical protein
MSEREWEWIWENKFAGENVIKKERKSKDRDEKNRDLEV